MFPCPGRADYPLPGDRAGGDEARVAAHAALLGQRGRQAHARPLEHARNEAHARWEKAQAGLAEADAHAAAHREKIAQLETRIVEVLLVYTIFKFRRREGGPAPRQRAKNAAQHRRCVELLAATATAAP